MSSPKIDIQKNISDEKQTEITNEETMDQVTEPSSERAEKFAYSPGFRKFFKIRRYIDSMIVRGIFLILSSYQIYFLSCIYKDHFYYLLYSYYFIIVIDGLWVIWKRGGRDYFWFSISFASYITVMIILIVFEMEYKYTADDINCETNRTILPKIGCDDLGFDYTICTLVEVDVVMFLASLVVGRWLLPQAERMDPHGIYTQVYGFTVLSADVIEIAQYMQNEDVAKSYAVMKSCQIVFGLSLIQFCFSLAAVKKRNVRLKGFLRVIDIVFSTEAWSQLLGLFSQEMPCFVVRMILITSVLSNKEYSLFFFTLKNFLMMLLMTFRSFSLCWKQVKSERKLQPLSL